MEPLFKATIYELIAASEFQLQRLNQEFIKSQEVAISRIKEIVASDVIDLKEIRNISFVSKADCQIEQYEEDLEYFKACLDWSKDVVLNKTEWRHYFQGFPTPELC